jgi:hypothetical protein
MVTLPAAAWQRLPRSGRQSAAVRRWSTVPDREDDKAEARIEQILRLASMGKLVWPIADTGSNKGVHRIAAPTLVLRGDADHAAVSAVGGFVS